MTEQIDKSAGNVEETKELEAGHFEGVADVEFESEGRNIEQQDLKQHEQDKEVADRPLLNQAHSRDQKVHILSDNADTIQSQENEEKLEENDSELHLQPNALNQPAMLEISREVNFENYQDSFDHSMQSNKKHNDRQRQQDAQRRYSLDGWIDDEDYSPPASARISHRYNELEQANLNEKSFQSAYYPHQSKDNNELLAAPPLQIIQKFQIQEEYKQRESQSKQDADEIQDNPSFHSVDISQIQMRDNCSKDNNLNKQEFTGKLINEDLKYDDSRIPKQNRSSSILDVEAVQPSQLMEIAPEKLIQNRESPQESPQEPRSLIQLVKIQEEKITTPNDGDDGVFVEKVKVKDRENEKNISISPDAKKVNPHQQKGAKKSLRDLVAPQNYNKLQKKQKLIMKGKQQTPPKVMPQKSAESSQSSINDQLSALQQQQPRCGAQQRMQIPQQAQIDQIMQHRNQVVETTGASAFAQQLQRMQMLQMKMSGKSQPAQQVAIEEEEKKQNVQNVVAAAQLEEVVDPMMANGSDTYRESKSVPCVEAGDKGSPFVFLQSEATHKMRQNKRKVKYVFDQEEDKNDPKPVVVVKIITTAQVISQPSQRLIAQEPVKRQFGEYKSKNSSVGESGQTPELFQENLSISSNQRGSRQQNNHAQGQNDNLNESIIEEEDNKIVVRPSQSRGHANSENLMIIQNQLIQNRGQVYASYKPPDKVSISHDISQNNELLVDDENIKSNFETEKAKPQMKELLALSQVNVSIQNNQSSFSGSISGSISNGSAFGNYSFHQASQAAIQAELGKSDQGSGSQHSNSQRAYSRSSSNKSRGINQFPGEDQASQVKRALEAIKNQQSQICEQKKNNPVQVQPPPMISQEMVPKNKIPPQKKVSPLNLDGCFDASKQLASGSDYQERRRGSVVEQMTDANKGFISYAHKEVKVRTPRRGRSKSIVVPSTQTIPRNFPIGRLNNYNKNMKKHKGPLSLMSELESIDEVELSDKFDNSYQHDFCNNELSKKDYSVDQGKPLVLFHGVPEGGQNQPMEGVNSAINQQPNFAFNNYEFSKTSKAQQQNDAMAGPVKAEELAKIVQAQSMRNRAYSVIQNSSNAPVLQPIKNFGHGRRSNLVQKVQQLQRRAQRSKSMAMGDINSHQILLRAQMLMNSQQDFNANQQKQQILQQNYRQEEAKVSLTASEVQFLTDHQGRFRKLSQPNISIVNQAFLQRNQFEADLQNQAQVVQQLTNEQMALIQIQQQKMLVAQNQQFSDYLMQFKNVRNTPAEVANQQSQDSGSGGNGSQKPLGLDQSKVRSALNNIKNGISPKFEQEEAEQCYQAIQIEEVKQHKALSNHSISGSIGKESASSFGNYTFQEAQKAHQQDEKVSHQQAQMINCQNMEELHFDLNNKHQRYHQMMPMVTNKVSEQDAAQMAQMQLIQNQQYAIAVAQQDSNNQNNMQSPMVRTPKQSTFGQYKFGQSSNSGSSVNNQEEQKIYHNNNQIQVQRLQSNEIEVPQAFSRRSSVQESSFASEINLYKPEAEGFNGQDSGKSANSSQPVDLVKMMKQLTKNGNQEELAEVFKVMKKLQKEKQLMDEQEQQRLNQ